AVSADGMKLAFVSRGSLWVKGDTTLRVADGDISGPAFFPDGEAIVFAEGRPGRRSIGSVGFSAEERREVGNRGDCYQPAVSPDESKLAFTCSEGGTHQVWILDFAQGSPRRVTSGACNNYRPAWDLDSRSVVFASDCSRGFGMTALYRAGVE